MNERGRGGEEGRGGEYRVSESVFENRLDGLFTMEAEGLEFVEDGEVQLRFVRDLDRGHVWQAVLNTIRKVRRVTRNKESERVRERLG